MRRFVPIVVLRLAAAAVFLLTAAYGVLCYSPFAFDRFVVPQLVPWISSFVIWHHLWFAAASAAAAVTLMPLLRPQPAADPFDTVAPWLARMYVAASSAVSVWLVASPWLPTLGNDARSLAAAGVSLVPLLWLAVIDHLSVAAPWRRSGDAPRIAGPRRLFVACALAACYVWALHLLHSLMTGESIADA